MNKKIIIYGLLIAVFIQVANGLTLTSPLANHNVTTYRNITYTSSSADTKGYQIQLLNMTNHVLYNLTTYFYNSSNTTLKWTQETSYQQGHIITPTQPILVYNSSLSLECGGVNTVSGYLRFSYIDGTTEDSSVVTQSGTCIQTEYIVANPNIGKKVTQITSYYKTSSGSITAYIWKTNLVGFNNNTYYNWDTYLYNKTVGLYQLNITGYGLTGAITEGANLTFNYTRNMRLTRNVYTYGTYNAVADWNMTLCSGTTGTCITDVTNNGNITEWIQGTNTYTITSSGLQDLAGNFTSTYNTQTYDFFQLPEKQLIFDRNTTGLLDGRSFIWNGPITQTYKNQKYVIVVNKTFIPYTKAILYFNMVNTTATNYQNHSQYYEWLVRDNSETFSENMLLINHSTAEPFFLSIQDCDRKTNLFESQVRIYSGLANDTAETQMLLTGQRYTESFGNTFFLLDPTLYNSIQVNASGYDVKTISLASIDNYNTLSTDPYIICMDLDNSLSSPYITVTYGRDFTQQINVSVYYTGDSVLRYGTGVSTVTNAERTSQYLQRYNLPLIPGTHFTINQTTPITLSIYEGATLYKEITIRPTNYTINIIEIPTETTETEQYTFKALIWILFILTILMIQWGMTRGQTTADSNIIGENTFMIGGLLLPIINTGFMGVAIVCGIYWALRYLRSFNSE